MAHARTRAQHAEQAELDIEQAEKFLLLVNTSLGPPPKDGVHVATVSQGTAAELEADSRHGKSLARQIIATMEGLLVAVRKVCCATPDIRPLAHSATLTG